MSQQPGHPKNVYMLIMVTCWSACNFLKTTIGTGEDLGASVRGETLLWLQVRGAAHLDAPSNHCLSFRRMPTWNTRSLHQSVLGQRHCQQGTLRYWRFEAQSASRLLRWCCAINHQGEIWEASLPVDEHCDLPPEIHTLFTIFDLELWRSTALQEPDSQHCPKMGGMVIQQSVLWPSPIGSTGK